MFRFRSNKINDDNGESPGGIAIVFALILGFIIYIAQTFCC